MLGKVIGFIAKAVDAPDPVEFIQGEISQLLQKAADFAQQLPGLIKEMVTGVVEAMLFQVGKTIALALAEKILALLNPAGALYTLLKTIYKAVKFFIDNLAKIQRLFTIVVDTFQSAVQGIMADALGMKVEDFLKGLIVPALDAIAKLIGIDSIPRKIQEVLRTIRDLAQKPVKAFLAALAKPIKKGFEAVLSKLGLGGTKALVEPTEYGKNKQKRVWVDERGTAMMQASEKRSVLPELERRKQRGDNRECLVKAIALTKELEGKGKTYAGKLNTKSNQSNVKTTTDAGKQVVQPQEALAKALDECECADASAARNACKNFSDDELRRTVIHIHRGFSHFLARTLRTTAIAVLKDVAEKFYCVFSVSGNFQSTEVTQRADQSGFPIYAPGSDHAEQNILAYANMYCLTLVAIAPCRPACGPAQRDCNRAVQDSGARLINPQANSAGQTDRCKYPED